MEKRMSMSVLISIIRNCFFSMIMLNSCQVLAQAPCNAQFLHYAGSNPDSIHFYATGTPGNYYYWNFGDSTYSTQANPWHMFAGPGIYRVCYTVNDSGTYCTSCDTVVIQGSSTPCDAEFIHYHSGTNADSVHFYPAITSGISYWSFGDSSSSTAPNPWHMYHHPGVYQVCHTVNDSGFYCTTCDTVIISGSTPPCNAGFIFYHSGNNPDSVHFYPNMTSGTSFYWSFGDSTSSALLSPWHLYTSPGTFTVCLTMNMAGTYCTTCDTVTITGIPNPCDAHFSHYVLSGNPDSVHFYGTGSSGTSWYWNFGDGTTSTEQNPWHFYTSAGSYTVCHYINNNGTYCSVCDTIVVSPSAPVCDAHYAHYSLGNPDSIHFYPVMTSGGFYYWTFGDGTTSTTTAPWHFFSMPGTYRVCLTVNDSGTYCTWCDSITVTGNTHPCDASFSHYFLSSNPDSVHFYGTGTAGSSWFWNFGDGSTSAQQNPWHLYASAGSYNVCHYINNNGVYCSVCDTVIISPLSNTCDAHFSHYSLGNPDSLHFYPAYTAGSYYYWTFGDGSTSTTITPWHFFPMPGTYSVCLTVNDSGTYCTWCDSIRVTGNTHPCNASFSHYSLLSNPDSVHFYGTGTPGTSWYWNFGDGTTSTLQNPWHLYSMPGSYNVCHYINNAGIYCSFCDTVVIAGSVGICRAEFTYYSLSNPDSVHFYPLSASGSFYYWTFGDGTTSTQHNAWHFYSGPGTYYVCLTVNDSGTYCTWCDSITVTGNSPPCVTHFAHYSLNNSDSIHFYPTGSPASSYSWDFGDGHSSSQPYPWHNYASPGTYFVCLTLDYSGTLCTWCDSVVVSSHPFNCNSQFAFYYMNNPDSLHFYPTAYSGSSNFWSFGDGDTSTEQYPWHYFALPGTYFICHSVNNSGSYCITCDSIIIGSMNFNFQLALNTGSNFYFDPNTATGIYALTTESPTFSIHPNPANESAEIILKKLSGPVVFKLIDMSGRIVFKENYLHAGITSFSTKEIKAGIYFYSIQEFDQIISYGKMIVLH